MTNYFTAAANSRFVKCRGFDLFLYYRAIRSNNERYEREKGVTFEGNSGHSLRLLDPIGAAFMPAWPYRYDISITQTRSNLMKIEKIFAEYRPLVTKHQSDGVAPTVVNPLAEAPAPR